ncbi:VOC family protein [Leucobacter triazinivorans]|uniref:VOC family protein n=1 Tax=Leucobacter triazinivorans TaxID=1784719 RepID=A0A4P6KEK4_9MICO|nr:VOC family protein [Leucobacter triazinivorans]QBE47834.1 VOC family protein [Leucobacter triazinivorans]
MSIRLNPYLNFHGNAREALEFYHSVLGGSLDLMRYDSIPGMMGGDDEAEKIMHGQLETEDGLTIMAADYPASMAEAPDASTGGNSISVSGDDAARIRAAWQGLAAGADIVEPFERAPWGDTFGMLRDRFGVPWMFSLAPQPEEADAG